MWRIYYGDGTRVDGEEARTVARRHGIICVVQPDERTGREVVTQHDWYYFKWGRWYGADTLGLMDQIVTFTDQIDCVMQGRMTDRQTYDSIVVRACDEPGLPRKSAKRKGEGL